MHTIQPPTFFRQKIFLIALGLLLTIFMLEAGLRFGGLIFVSLQEYRNMRAIKQKGTYRVMCLGESTSVCGGKDSYPSQMEEILNQHNIGIRFSVINSGVVAVNTSYILEHLEANLNKYHPDLVVAMIGINDGVNTLPYETKSYSKIWHFLKSLRIYKLTQFIWSGLANKLNNSKQGNFKEAGFGKNIKEGAVNDRQYFKLGESFIDKGDFNGAEEMFKKVVELNPRNDQAYVELGRLYRLHHNVNNEAENLVRQAIELNPRNSQAYVELGECYLSREAYSQAEEMFKKAIELNSSNNAAYLGLAYFYTNFKKYPLSEEMFQKS